MCTIKCPLITSLFINKIIQKNITKYKQRLRNHMKKRQILQVLKEINTQCVC